jgi:hypothetical protein
VEISRLYWTASFLLLMCVGIFFLFLSRITKNLPLRWLDDREHWECLRTASVMEALFVAF